MFSERQKTVLKGLLHSASLKSSAFIFIWSHPREQLDEELRVRNFIVPMSKRECDELKVIAVAEPDNLFIYGQVDHIFTLPE